MAIGIKKKKYQSQPTGRAPTLEEEQDSVLAEMAHQIAAGMEPQTAFRPRVPGGELTLPMPPEYAGASPEAQAIMELARTRHQPKPAQIIPGMAAPGRVPMNLSPEEAAAIDAEAGIGAPVAMRDPLNPRAGGLPIGILRSQPQGTPEQLAEAQGMVDDVNARHSGGIAVFNPPQQFTSTAGQQAMRRKQLNENPEYQAMLAANRAVGDQLENGNASLQDVQFGSLRTPAMHIGSTTSRTPDEISRMEDKNRDYRAGLEADEAMRRENLQRKIAMRGMSPRMREAQQMIGLMGANGGGDMNPMMIGLLTGDPRAAQLAMEMQKTQALQDSAAADRDATNEFRRQQLANDQARIGIARDQLEVDKTRAGIEGDNNWRATYQTFRNDPAYDLYSDEDVAKLADSRSGRQRPADWRPGDRPMPPPAPTVTPELGREPAQTAPPQQQTPVAIDQVKTDLDAAKAAGKPDAFFEKYGPERFAPGGNLASYLPKIRQQIGDEALREYVGDSTFFDADAASKRNQLAGSLGMPQTSVPIFSIPSLGINTPSNYRPEQDPWNAMELIKSLLGITPERQAAINRQYGSTKFNDSLGG